MTTPLHPRSDWVDPKYPVTGPSCDLRKIEYITLHWPGGSVSPAPGNWTPHETVVDLQGEQKNYVTTRGYSIGYNFCVDYIGHRWILRGYDFKCAANGGSTSNTKGLAIQLKMDINQSPTPAMIDGTRDMVAEIRGRINRSLPINGHRDVRPEPTSCPGAIIYRMIQDGVFEPQGIPDVPIPPVTPGKVGKKMFLVFQWTGDPTTWWVTDTVQYRRIWDFNAINLIYLWQSYLGYPVEMRKTHQLDNSMIHCVGAPAPGAETGPWPAGKY